MAAYFLKLIQDDLKDGLVTYGDKGFGNDICQRL